LVQWSFNLMTDVSLVLLTVRGKLTPATAEAGRKLHNETAGSPPGIAAARALGDLSHKVYTPLKGIPGAEDGEVLFLDYWTNAEGIGKFFGDPQVQGTASKLFSTREGVMWMPAHNAFSFQLPAPMDRKDRFLGVVRGTVGSPDAAINAFRDTLAPKLADARRRGQLSHELFVRIPMPGDASKPEIIGLDLWCDGQGMSEHYKEIGGIYQVFSDKPQTSVWEPAQGGVWSEW
jgi:hypothetical protein